MIEDTLTVNPGMKETYRAYGRLMVCESSIARAEAELKTLRVNGASSELFEARMANLAGLRARLKEHHAEAMRCLAREDKLRVELGLPPLEQRVLNSARESLKKYEEIFQEQDAASAAV